MTAPPRPAAEDARTTSCVWTVVVNWRQMEATLACLASLEAAGVDPGTIIVIDNGSGDDCLERVRERHPRATLLPQPENLGFAKAVNIGLRHALAHGADAVLLMNNDAVLAPGAVREMVAHLERSPRVGIVTAKIFLTKETGRLWAVGGTFTGRRVVELGAGERDTGTYDDRPLDFAYGCALLLRAEVVRDTGGFDERFFLYYEDIDLCLRARAAGWEVAMAPRAHVWHEGSKSTRGEPAAKIYHHARSRLLFFTSHLAPAHRVSFAVSEAAFIARRIGEHLVRGEPKSAMAYVRGTLDAMRDRRRVEQSPLRRANRVHGTNSGATAP